ncbi:optic atrophy 3 protein homolog [Battus philenor]|uniref:optic atrophy 3 protein homolog n=1 Tax=Battus philenor TaxID=42288 RepID=UPI0035CF4154
MVVGAFPIAKLSVLLIKQISKPIANVCKERAKNNPFFRTYVCMPPAQFYNWCEVKAKMWILNLGKPVNIPVLSQEMAIELGANLLGETVIFVIGAGLLLIEYNRQSNKEAAKEAKRKQEMDHITGTITDLYFTVQHQQTQLRELERLIQSLDKGPASPPTQPVPPSPSPASKEPSIQSPSSASSAPIPHNVNHNRHFITVTPYPDKGIILQSLNYIQMDAFSSLFNNKLETETKPPPKTSKNHEREPAILSQALYNIENNFRSMF